MATILLFHSVRGRRELERAAAERLRAAGHRVTVADLFDGETASTLEEGIAIEERLWPEPLLGRAAAAADALPPDAVLAGFSMGANVATQIWAERPATAGLLLLHGLGEIPEAPRAGVPVQAHLAEPDAFAPEDDVAAWQTAAPRKAVGAEVFRYAGAGHLFTDPSLPDHDAAAAALLWERGLAFLAALDERAPR
jgi:dienelactone hydrolase